MGNYEAPGARACLMPVASELLIVMRLRPRTMVPNGVLIGLARGIVAADHPGASGHDAGVAGIGVEE